LIMRGLLPSNHVKCCNPGAAHKGRSSSLSPFFFPIYGGGTSLADGFQWDDFSFSLFSFLSLLLVLKLNVEVEREPRDRALVPTGPSVFDIARQPEVSAFLRFLVYVVLSPLVCENFVV